MKLCSRGWIRRENDDRRNRDKARTVPGQQQNHPQGHVLLVFRVRQERAKRCGKNFFSIILGTGKVGTMWCSCGT